jgi:tetratricopeptide (TPR) repeat protein
MLDGVWTALQAPDNRAMLGWIGGGFAVTVGGVWAVFKFFISKKPTVSASRGGVAVGRDILDGKINRAGRDATNNTLNVYNRVPETLQLLARQLDRSDADRRAAETKAAELARQLNLSHLTTQTVVQFLRILARQPDLTLEQVPAKMAEITTNYEQMQARLAALSPQDPAAANLAQQAAESGAAGRFDEADRLLEQAETRETPGVDEHRVKAAELRAARGDNAATQLRYADAAKHYEAAAVLLPPGASDAKAHYLVLAGDALRTHGDQRGDNVALTRSIALYKDALTIYTRKRVPLDWASTQNNLGIALSTLGAREAGTARLDEAVAAYREALKEYTRERVPLDWAMTQDNLGSVLRVLGEREGGTVRLEEALVAYRDALMERTRDRVPLDWAQTQNNLGNALLALGAREAGTTRLEEAVAAYREALKEYTRERVPLGWATTQSNLGNALKALGEREGGTARLVEAVAAYREALKEYSRERVPLGWATTQSNLGHTLKVLGEREAGTTRLEEAVAAYRAAAEAEAGWDEPRLTMVRAALSQAQRSLADRRGDGP